MTESSASQATGTAPAAPGKPPARVTLTWEGEQRFSFARTGGGPATLVDGSSRAAPSPVETLVGALAACVSADVVEILAKRRTPAREYTVNVVAERAQRVPARLVHVRLDFRIVGEGIERVHAERAIDLALTKYCSIRDSLDPALPIEWTLELA